MHLICSVLPLRFSVSRCAPAAVTSRQCNALVAGAEETLLPAGVFPVVISQAFAVALTIYTVATQLLLYYVRTPK